MTNTEFYDLTNAAVIGWNAAVKRCCDRQPTSHPENLTAETICQLTGLLPLYPFVVPEGHVRIAGTRTVDTTGGVARESYDVESEEAYAARVEAAQAAALEARIAALPDALVAAYLEFRTAYQQALQAALQAGASIDTSVTYKGLVGALRELNSHPDTRAAADWMEIAFALANLWQAVVVASGLNPGEAYALLPLLERRAAA